MNPRNRLACKAALFALSASLLTATCIQALAWGSAGHRLVATVAESQLMPAAKDEVARLLVQEPGATLASISTWADEVRNPATAPWHYVNFPREGTCNYSHELCAGGSCVVEAIERQTALLASKAPDAERLLALKYVVHFVADAHQPLHAGYADDKGGNNFQLQAFDRGTNLHALWEFGLIQNWPGGMDALQTAVAKESVVADSSPAAWAEAACLLVGDTAFYPATRRLDADYPVRWAPTLRRQLALASRRLAEVLNRSLRK